MRWRGGQNKERVVVVVVSWLCSLHSRRSHVNVALFVVRRSA